MHGFACVTGGPCRAGSGGVCAGHSATGAGVTHPTRTHSSCISLISLPPANEVSKRVVQTLLQCFLVLVLRLFVCSLLSTKNIKNNERGIK